MRRLHTTRRGPDLRIAPRLTGLATAIALAVPVASSALPAAAAVEDPASDPLSEAQTLYQEGTTLYSAAEYIKAVEKWTEALDIITKSAMDSDQAYQIRGALLLNIAKARVNAYDVDRDVANLRKGRAIYQRFVDEAEQGQYSPNDVAEATREIEAIDAKIVELEEKQAAVPPPEPTTPPENVDTGPGRDLDAELAVRKKRGVGIGLLAGGSGLVAGGVAAIIYGSFFETWARDDIRRNDSDPSTTDPDEQAYLDSEKQKGVVWMGVGGALVAVGIGGVAGGAVVFTRANRKLEELQGLSVRELRAAPVVSRDFAGLSLSGRF